MAGGAIAAAEGINKVVVLAKTVLELSKKAANLELQELIMQLREAVLEAKEEVLALRDENRALKELLQAQTEWNSKASAYRLVKTDGGAIVMYTAGPPVSGGIDPRDFGGEARI